jgi:TRAP-type mannitol/chloroaromatic compound transport system substrate-binding protein
MRGDRGDYIIHGAKGEIYPCKHDIFTNEFEPERDEKAELIERVRRLSEENGDILKVIDRARSLLQRCDTEMHYAGWAKHTADNPQHKELYTDIVEFLRGVNHWKLVGSTTNNKGG